jgi:hypothetical protein
MCSFNQKSITSTCEADGEECTNCETDTNAVGDSQIRFVEVFITVGVFVREQNAQTSAFVMSHFSFLQASE